MGKGISIHAEADLETRNGNPADGRKVRGTIHWVSCAHCLDAEVELYDKLFTESNMNSIPDDADFKDYLNPDSVKVLQGAKLEESLKGSGLVPAGILGFAGLVLIYFARGQWFVLAAGIVMLGGGMVVSACCSGLIRDYTPAGKAGLFQGIRIVFQVLLPMVTGPYIGAAVIRGTGMTYEDLGTVKQVPTAEIFLAAAAALVLLAIPAALLKRKETVK